MLTYRARATASQERGIRGWRGGAWGRREKDVPATATGVPVRETFIMKLFFLCSTLPTWETLCHVSGHKRCRGSKRPRDGPQTGIPPPFLPTMVERSTLDIVRDHNTNTINCMSISNTSSLVFLTQKDRAPNEPPVTSTTYAGPRRHVGGPPGRCGRNHD